MKTRCQQRSCAQAFTLLEVVIVLAITALVLGAVYSLAQGTLILADDVSRAQRRDTHSQAFSAFCEHLFADLPAEAVLNLTVTQAGGEYLSRLELQHVPSPFDGTPDSTVTLFTESLTGGGMRLMITCRIGKESAAPTVARAILFDELQQQEWRAFDSTTRQWITGWNNTTKPVLMEFSMTQGGAPRQQVFWIPPNAQAAISK